MSQLIVSSARAAGSAFSSFGANLAKTAASTLANTASSFALSQAQALIFGPGNRKLEGPQIDSFQLQTSTEGAPIPRLYGRARLAGQIIWASNFLEQVSTQTSGGKGARPKPTTQTTTYLYSISLAIGLCEGKIDRIGRVWADGKQISLQDYTYRVYQGTEDQLPDSVIDVVEGSDQAPAYRGLAYIVFEDLPLEAFGNRIPQFNFEVEKSIHNDQNAVLENMAQAVTLIPGSGEQVYGTTPILRQDSEGRSVPENIHNNTGRTDFSASVDILQSSLPNCKAVSLVTSWFGTDLRAESCEIKPGVERLEKQTWPDPWRVGGQTRPAAYRVSEREGAPAYGGTPSDKAVIEALIDLKQRGLSVMFYPFILMDIPQGNTLPDPSDGIGQAVYPWRGRIVPGADVDTDVSALFGAAQVSDFHTSTGEVIYTGPDEWSLRRMVLHYAHLCVLAGGVESFLIGSEMRGLTTAQHSDGSFPAVLAYKALAQDVRSIVGHATTISYAADWSEYSGYQPPGTGDKYFHLDPLWTDENIDFIGIDNYMPIADWRDGKGHLDALAGAQSAYDIAYLHSNIAGGENYDWYYASTEDRENQLRTPIEDFFNEPWIYRAKDLVAWWQQPHHERIDGIRQSSGPWVPQSKPIRFTELGCPAIDRGANQPNVFYDPKSSENAIPFFSSGQRDDLMQRRFLEAHLSWWDDPGHNPVSGVTNTPMVDTEHVYLYTWDARPYPEFPARTDVWADSENWYFGHWLNGRVGKIPLGLLVEALALQAGVTGIDTSKLQGLVDGYVLDRPMTARAAIEPLAGIYQFDAVEREGILCFQPRDGLASMVIAPGDLVAPEASVETGEYQITRAQATELPAVLDIVYLSEQRAYQPAVAEASDPAAIGIRRISLQAPLILDGSEAEARARALLSESRAMHDTASLSLPPSFSALEPTDVITLETPSGALDFRITEITDGEAREVSLVRSDPSVYDFKYIQSRRLVVEAVQVPGPPVLELLDLPSLTGEAEPVLRGAAFAEPWPGAVSVYSAAEGTTPVLRGSIPSAATLGRLEQELKPGYGSRWQSQTIKVKLNRGSLTDRSRLEVLNGANLAVVRANNGQWEVLQFEKAELLSDETWQLSCLLRGQYGTEQAALSGANQEARFILLDEAITAFNVPVDLIGIPLDWQAGPEGQIPDTDNFVHEEVVFDNIAARPLSPVHARARRLSSGIELRWIRRSRVAGGGWGVVDVPVGEVQERYQVQIRNGDAVIRTTEAASPVWLYAEAALADDFGDGQAVMALEVDIAQISERYGPGVALREVVAVRG